MSTSFSVTLSTVNFIKCQLYRISIFSFLDFINCQLDQMSTLSYVNFFKCQPFYSPALSTFNFIKSRSFHYLTFQLQYLPYWLTTFFFIKSTVNKVDIWCTMCQFSKHLSATYSVVFVFDFVFFCIFAFVSSCSPMPSWKGVCAAYSLIF